MRINDFLTKITPKDRDPYILTHWAGVRFLLDTQRAAFHERRTSRCFQRVDWSDFHLTPRDDWHFLEYHPKRGGGGEDLGTIQASMLELVIPILPHRLSEDWRKVIEQIDILDVPGMRAGRQGAEQGKRTSADSLDEQMEIVKRGKVAYLFERYTDELLIQTLLLLCRGGNLEVTAQMKFHIDKWGRARYGEDIWPMKVRDALPSFFLGVTGIDEEFRDREEYADPMLYNTRLTQIVDALGPVMNDFGGKGKSFSNCYPIRYPGTWDANQRQREKAGADKWDHAGQAFLKSKMVGRFMANPQMKWEAAMGDDDGGLSLISAGWREVTTAEKKQNQLDTTIDEIYERLLALSRSWVVNPDANVDRMQRIDCAKRVMDWLTSDHQLIYDRVRALESAMCLADGDQFQISDFADMPSRSGSGRPDSMERRFPQHLQEYFHEWATFIAPKKWEEHTEEHPNGGPWLGTEDFCQMTRYMRDYLCSNHVFDDISTRLQKVVGLRLRDEGAKRRARRRYTQVIMNDLFLNPGLNGEKIVEVDEESMQDFGLMSSFVSRWSSRLGECLAAGAGSEIRIPPGNTDLIDILDPHGKLFD